MPANATPNLSPLLRRIVAAVQPGETLRKADIAKRVGIGRGSANRAVDALRSKGLFVGEADLFGPVVPAPSPPGEKPSSKPKSSSKALTKRPPSIESRILAMMEPGRPIHVSQILKRFHDVRESSVSVQIVRMTHSGVLRQLARGIYAVPFQSPTAQPRADLHAVVFAMPPGRVFDTRTLSRETGLTLSAASLALQRLLVSGMVIKVTRARYARSGAEPQIAPSVLPSTTLVRETMAKEDRIWATREIQAVLDVTHPGTVAAWTLNNMRKTGHIERVVPGRWRLLDRPLDKSTVAPSAHALSQEIARSVPEFLSKGGLHSLEFISDTVGATRFVAHSMLRDLERQGLAVRFLDRRWLWAGHEDVACPIDGTFDRPRVAQRLLHIGVDTTTPEIVQGLTKPARIAWALRSLVDEGLAERPAYFVHRIARRAAVAFAARLSGPPRKPMSVEDHRAYDLFGEKALTIEGLAQEGGLDLSKAHRVVERLLLSGRLVEVDADLYMAC